MNNGRPSKRQQSRKKRRRNIDVIAAVIVVCIIVFIGIALVNYINYFRLNMVQVSKSTVSNTVDCDVVVLRDEQIIYAPALGQFINTYEDGAKVKEGSIIGYMSPVEGQVSGANQTAVYTDRGGLIYYELDGWEDTLNPVNILSLDWPAVFAQFEDETKTSSSQKDVLDNTGPGRKIARIIDNLNDYYLCLHVEINIDNYRQNDRIVLEFPGLVGYTVEAHLVQTDQIDSQSQYLFATIDLDEPFFDTFRYGNAKIVGDTISGMKIPLSALTKDEEGNTGVFLSRMKELAFREVSVIYEGEDFALVSGLKITDRVAAKPQYAKVGQKIY